VLLEPEILWPLPDDHVYIEFFSLPNSLTQSARFLAIKKKLVIPYNLPFKKQVSPRKKEKTSPEIQIEAVKQEWDSDLMDNMLVVSIEYK